MESFDTILNDALRLYASELILENGKEIQFIKQNNIQSMSQYGVIENAWLEDLTKTLLGNEFPKFGPEQPQKNSFPVNTDASAQVVARINGRLVLRIFLPPAGEQLCEQYWDTISDESSNLNQLPTLSQMEIAAEEPKAPEAEASDSDLGLELGIDNTPLTEEVEPLTPIEGVDLNASIAPVEGGIDLNEATPPEPEVKADKPINSRIVENSFDLNSAVSFGTAPSNAESAPSTAPLPPLPPPPHPETVPELEKIDDPGSVLNTADETSTETPTIDFSMPPPEPIIEDLGIQVENTEAPELDLTSSLGDISISSEPTQTASAPVDNVHTIRSEGASLGTIGTLLQEMQTLKASHLHLLSGHLPYFRIQDDLVQNGSTQLNEESIKSLLNPILPTQKKWEDLQEINFLLTEKTRNYRVHVFKEFNGISAVIQIISSEIPSFDQLNLPQRMNELCEFKEGLVLIAGPSENLLTLVLASVTAHIGDFLAGRIISLENQISYLQKPKAALASQREVGLHTESFAKGLRAALEENPDVLALGSVNDSESAQLALKASANTLVFACINAHSLPEARAILDGLLANSPKLLIDTLLRDIVFVELASDGKIQPTFSIGPSAATKAS